MNCTEKKYANPPSRMTENDFVETFGGVYEHSPWIARYAWHQGLNENHNTPKGLSEIMMAVVASAEQHKILALINAHPDLAGKAALNGELTEESTSEQSGAGIDQCTPEEFEKFQYYNNVYQEKFRFPFIMAVKGSNRHQILDAFVIRVENDEETEFQQAVAEINKIALFRLDALAEA
ncbi:MAG: 2-oxo-4-hydroxy-4-carboxy-5-ureidoimidazoline decarboxylase [Cocleimonas sp.]|jgi:2-oxo-4-hydroxy-4-carboxy-5-ureidoimidazoline decarboxylase